MVDHKKATRTRRIVEDFVSCLFRGEKIMPQLYYVPPSPPCRAVLLLGRLLNIKFELRFLDLLNGEQLKPEFVEVRQMKREKMRMTRTSINLTTIFFACQSYY